MYKVDKWVVQCNERLQKTSRAVGQIELYSSYMKSGDVTKI